MCLNKKKSDKKNGIIWYTNVAQNVRIASGHYFVNTGWRQYYPTCVLLSRLLRDNLVQQVVLLLLVFLWVGRADGSSATWYLCAGKERSAFHLEAVWAVAGVRRSKVHPKWMLRSWPSPVREHLVSLKQFPFCPFIFF